MIKFVTVDRLRPGVTLAKDVYGIDTFTGHIIMLKAGQLLSMAHITKLMGLDLQGVYINDHTSAAPIIPEEERTEIYKLIDDLQASADPAYFSLYKEKIEEANAALLDFVDIVLRRDDLQLSLDSLDFNDNDKSTHALSIAILSIVIAKELGLSKPDILRLTCAAIIHDLGDTRLPKGLLEKPAKLTDEEFEIVKTHAKLGYDILQGEEYEAIDDSVKEAVLSHHERFDGSGYPRSLSSDEIPLFARIMAVADVYSALTSERPYRTAYSAAEAIEYIMGNSDRQFDSNVVTAFLKVISPYPIGSCVKLSSGENAVVSKQNPENPLRPVVFLIDDPTAIIDLYHDKCFYNVVITDLMDN